jgi:transposase
VQSTRDEVIGAYKSFFALRKNGHTQHHTPKFRRKPEPSPLKYLQSGFSVNDNTLTLSLGSSREDGMKTITLKIEHRPDIDLSTSKIKGATITYDKQLGFKAHLVIETPPIAMIQEGLTVAVDLGEMNLITAVFSDEITIIYSGRIMKAVRRYWQKVRAKVKPCAAPTGSSGRPCIS